MKNTQIIYGIHAVVAVLQKRPQDVLELYLDQQRGDNRMRELTQLALQNDITIQWSLKATLNQLSNKSQHQGVVAKVRQGQTAETIEDIIENLDSPAFILILDGITDPHNLGACLRSADAAGVHAVIAPKDGSVGITPTVSKVASGAAENIPYFQVTNLSRTIKYLQQQGVWIHGLADAANANFYEQDYTGSIALVLGAEGKGMRRLTKDSCDYLVSIPMAGSVSSLNVSVAAGICLYEVVRQRR